MVDNYRDENVINGSFGEVWVDGDYMAEVKGLKADIGFEYEDVNKPRKLGKGKKMIGYEGTGEVTFYKVTSKFIKLVVDNLKQGKQTTIPIISKLDDPDALGAERILIKDATLEGISLANWEAKTLGEEAISFSFSEFDTLDLI